MGDKMTQKATLLLREMKYFLKIGVTKEEQKHVQPLFFDLDIDLDIANAGKNESLQETIDYTEIQKSLETFLKGKEYCLIEALVEDVAGMLLKQFPKINQIQITCWKPRALAKKKVKNVGIQIIKTRE